MTKDENKQKILLKIEKLGVLAAQGIEGERHAAKRLYDELCARYDIDPDAIESEKPKPRRISFRKGQKDLVMLIMRHLEIMLYRNIKRFTVSFDATDTEWRLFALFYREIDLLHRRRLEQASLEVRSFMRGYVKTQYPVDWSKPVKCPNFECGEVAYAFNKDEGRFECSQCGFHARRSRGRGVRVDGKAFGEGQAATQKLVGPSKLSGG